jgi:hypothetical protein
VLDTVTVNNLQQRHSLALPKIKYEMRLVPRPGPELPVALPQ